MPPSQPEFSLFAKVLLTGYPQLINTRLNSPSISLLF